MGKQTYWWMLLGAAFLVLMTWTAQADWQQVGQTGFTFEEAEYFNLAIDIDSGDTPYVAYGTAPDQLKASVMSFNGTSWEQVGVAGFSPDSASDISLALDSSGTPYVAYRGDYADGGKASVMRFNGTSWEQVGAAGFSPSSAYDISLAFDSSDRPYVAYRDYAADDWKASVMRFNGASWEQVGTAGFSPDSAYDISLVLDSSDTPYVAYRDGADGYKASVMRFNGTSWEQVGAAGFSPSSAYDISLALDSSDTPYVAYRDDAAGRKVSVMRFNGTSWEQVGTAGFSPDSAYDISLAFDSNGRPYVAFNYWDNTNNSYKVGVMRFNGTSWEQVGTAFFFPGSAYDISLALDSSGSPYVAFSYWDNADGYKASVMRFNGTSWEQVGAAGFSPSSAYDISLAFDSNGKPYIACTVTVNRKTAAVMRFNGASWEQVGAASFLAGSANYTSLALDSASQPYVVYKDNDNGGKASVTHFNGTSWEQVGAAGFSPGSIYDYDTQLALDSSDRPYVAYRDDADGSKVSVMRFNGTNWEQVGAAFFFPSSAYDISLVLDSSVTPYVAFNYWDNTNNGRKVGVMSFNGTSWEQVGAAVFFPSSAYDISLAFDSSDRPYVAYRDYAADDWKASVMRFNGASWEQVGTAGFSPDSADDIRLALDSSGRPYVAFSYWDSTNNSSKVGVMRFNGTSWEQVGGAGFSSDSVYYNSIQLALDSRGTPYVAFNYWDNTNNSSKTSVMRFVPNIAITPVYELLLLKKK